MEELEKILRSITNDLSIIADRIAKQAEIFVDPELPADVAKYLNAYTQKQLVLARDTLTNTIDGLNQTIKISPEK